MNIKKITLRDMINMINIGKEVLEKEITEKELSNGKDLFIYDREGHYVTMIAMTKVGNEIIIRYFSDRTKEEKKA